MGAYLFLIFCFPSHPSSCAEISVALILQECVEQHSHMTSTLSGNEGHAYAINPHLWCMIGLSKPWQTSFEMAWKLNVFPTFCFSPTLQYIWSLPYSPHASHLKHATGVRACFIIHPFQNNTLTNLKTSPKPTPGVLKKKQLAEV